MDGNSLFSAPVIASLITAIVTLVGIIISYKLSKKNLEGEIESIKMQHSVERMQDLPARVASLLDKLKTGMDVEEMNRLLSDTYAYGSPEAIRILVSFQRMNYAVASGLIENTVENNYRLLGHLSLLIAQLKYDLSGQFIDPEAYFQMKITDYGANGITAGPQLKALVEELDLDNKLIPKSQE